MLAAYGSLVLTLFLGCFWAWGWLGWRLITRQPILPREPRRDVPWGLVDLLLTFALYVLLSIGAVSVLQIERAVRGEMPAKVAVEEESALQKADSPQLTLNGWRTMIVLDSSVKMLVVALIFVFITLRYRATLTDFGISLPHLATDLQIGTVLFLAIYLPMMALQVALVYGLKWKYEHPLIESVSETKDLLLFTLAGIAAAIIAPVIEEFVFRGLLQGWLEKLFGGNATKEMLFAGGRHQPEVEIFTPTISAEQPPLDPNPYAPPTPLQYDKPSFQFRMDQTFTPPSPRDWLAIAISMIVFSGLHISHGPGWIPLLIFGAATGLVYQRTHRIVPGIVAHFLLNATSMFGVWVQVFGSGLPK